MQNTKHWIADFQVSNDNMTYFIGFNDNNIDNIFFILQENNGVLKKITDIPAPVENINNPYFIKNQVRFFKLINDRFLYIGIRHLYDRMYIVVVDTKDSNRIINTLTFDGHIGGLYSDLFVDQEGDVNIIGSDPEPFLVTLKKGATNISEKHYFSNISESIVSSGTLLPNENFVLAATVLENDKGSNKLFMYEHHGKLLKERFIEGFVLNILPGSNNSLIVERTLDQDAIVVDTLVFDDKLQLTNSYSLPPLSLVADPSGSQTMLSNSELILTRINRKPDEDFYGDISIAGPGRQLEELYRFPKDMDGKSAAYDATTVLDGDKIYIGISIAEEQEKGFRKIFEIHELELTD